MKCPGIMPRVAFDSIFPPARRIHWWFMKWSLRSFIYSFVFFGALFFPSSSVSGACSWNGLFLWSLLEGNPRKFGVVVVAAKLISLASPYPSFVYPPLSLGRHTHFLAQACRNQASSTTPIFLSSILHPTPSLTWSLTGACYPSLFLIPIETTLLPPYLFIPVSFSLSTMPSIPCKSPFTYACLYFPLYTTMHIPISLSRFPHYSHHHIHPNFRAT